jgi:acetate kinase
MKILSVNAGSSSLKFTLFNMIDESVIASGVFERIGLDGSKYTIKYNGDKIVEAIDISNHTEAVKILLDKLISLDIVKNYEEIKGVGHRILHGKDLFSESVFLDDGVLHQLEELVSLGPLHMGANINGVRAFKEVLPDVEMVGVFDTAFHQTMNEEAYLFSVPYRWYHEYGLRKYGFHGISHQYITNCVKELLGREDFKLISCHIGNGGSVTAVSNMKCVDTSMGFTPLAGVIMGTRSGDVDPSIIPYIMEKEGKNASEVLDDLNRLSGVLGISEASSDMRDIVSLCESGNEKALLARNKYVRRIVDYIAQYYVLLGGCDMIVLTAGVGENNIEIRKEICEKLAPLGVELDDEKNAVRGEMIKITTDSSKIPVYVIPTNEELMIARETYRLLNR